MRVYLLRIPQFVTIVYFAKILIKFVFHHFIISQNFHHYISELFNWICQSNIRIILRYSFIRRYHFKKWANNSNQKTVTCLIVDFVILVLPNLVSSTISASFSLDTHFHLHQCQQGKRKEGVTSFILVLGVSSIVIAVEMTDYSPIKSSPIAVVRHSANLRSMNLPGPDLPHDHLPCIWIFPKNSTVTFGTSLWHGSSFFFVNN